jgi:Spy/CpxP family protein refolding chaperone
MHRIKLSVALLSLLVTATAAAQANTPAPRRFALPEHGQFVIPVPADWKGQMSPRGNGTPPTITFTPASGKPFQVVMTTIWPATRDGQPQSRDQLRAAVQRGLDSAKTQAVEKELRVVEFQGRSGPGFYFSATDRAPKPDEYKFLTQGVVRVGELSVTFTILTNDGQDAIVKQALDALKGATQEPTA